tara:strand:- start:230 stop:571 length:342 start_codon:yes stop_codon:yes gene_type:complete
VRKLLFLFFIITTLVHSQKPVDTEQTPCSDRTIIFARKHGVKALPIKDLPQFFKASKACEEKGGETLLEQIDINEYNRDFRSSKFMSGWTSTYGMCVTVIIFYFFVGLITVDK